MATGVLTPLPRSSRSAQAWEADTTGLPFPAASTAARSAGVSAHFTASGSESGPLAVGESFGPRYRILRLLGIGGMGAVYQAWDAELDVVVALKVIWPEATIDPEEARALERRFKQELLLARQVTHKNVVRIHDLGEINGIKYITMSYLEGADLATVLKELGKLQVSITLKLARQIAAGLAAAHEAGVVHRDLKPANIMIEGDNAVIMDFGIARSSSGGRPPVAPGMLPAGLLRHVQAAQGTLAGTIIGTVTYMAPEQARGEAVDQRADIYAFGLIVSDMLVGGRAQLLDLSPIDELQRRMKERPPSLRSADPDIPEAVDAIVSRCVEPDPAARFQTTSELVAALDRLDDQGIPIPEPRRFTPRLSAAAVLLVAGLVTGTWWLTRTPPPVKPHDPVSVLIADFDNRTNDPTFDHMLEPMFRLALEGATFISAHDRSRIRASFGMQPPEKLDEAAARQIAMKQSVGIVLSGSIDRQGDGYDISIKAAQPITGNVTASAKSRASSKDQVLGTVTRLASTVRRVLGEKTSESDQLFAMRSISETSLNVISEYAAGIELQSKGKYEEARQRFLKAVELDPKFGLGYQSLAVNSRNVGKLQDADKYAKEALKYLDGMTEREKFSTRGNYYRVTGDLQQCVREYGELLTLYAADTVAHNQRAICFVGLRDMGAAVAEIRKALQILPNHMTYRGNLALWAAYAGDFATAEREVRAIQNPSARALQALPLSLVGQGRLQEAAEAYQRLGTMGTWGASFSASGLGDLALYEGRYADAARIFERGAATDLSAKNGDAAALKLVALAHVHLARGQSAAAVGAADRALANSTALPVRFLAARALVDADAIPKAQTLAADLASQLATIPQAYAKLIEGHIALKKRDFAEAVKILSEANGVIDTWIGHFDLGRAYLEGGAFAQADAEFDRCIKRRGEVLSLVDEDPTYGNFPPVYYYLGRARAGLQAGFADSYREYLKIRGESTEDPLVLDARKRAAG